MASTDFEVHMCNHGGLAFGSKAACEFCAPKPAPGVPEHPNFTTHREAWRVALDNLAREDDSGYWEHELKAFDDAYAGKN